ncbi:hypothetical protein A8B74_07490 [Sulfitobacter geojensis]|nr:hypothetical protein A8B74_07490 [Sulfitobacter geojensis]
MTKALELDCCCPLESLNILANLLELALHAPDGEVTFQGRVSLQRAAMKISALSGEILDGDLSLS